MYYTVACQAGQISPLSRDRKEAGHVEDGVCLASALRLA